jgi:predicted Rossmann fold flavoprotein
MRTAQESDTIYDVIVIGGGASGMMAAGKAAECGASVLLVEKNKTLGKKLLITGGGRCNLTNDEPDIKKFLDKFKDDKKFLFSPFSNFSSSDTISFFTSRGMPTKTEAHHRVFPLSNSAESVHKTLLSYLKEHNVTILTNAKVTSINKKDTTITDITLAHGQTLRGRSYIIATGGKSHPETGSTGDGFAWLSSLGHTIQEPSYALTPIITEEQWGHTLSGVSIDMARVTINLDGKPQQKHTGKILFTHFGLSGPMILNMSKHIGELLPCGTVTLTIDLFPHMDIGVLDVTLREHLLLHKNKKLKNSLSEILPPAIMPSIIDIAHVDKDKPINILTKEERKRITICCKALTVTVAGLMGEDKAIITSGGLSLHEVVWKTIQSSLYSNLFIIGDMLNIDRPSGGYSLQLCWTTGQIAGEHAARLFGSKK